MLLLIVSEKNWALWDDAYCTVSIFLLKLKMECSYSYLLLLLQKKEAASGSEVAVIFQFGNSLFGYVFCDAFCSQSKTCFAPTSMMHSKQMIQCLTLLTLLSSSVLIGLLVYSIVVYLLYLSNFQITFLHDNPCSMWLESSIKGSTSKRMLKLKVNEK